MKEKAVKEKDLGTQDGAVQFALHLQKWLRRDFELRGRVIPSATVLATFDPKTGKPFGHVGVITILPETLKDNGEKDGYITLVRQTARQYKAVGVLMAFEAWVLEGDKELRRQAGKSLEHAPGRTESVEMHLEHASFVGTKRWSARITRDSAGKGTLLPFTLDETTEKSEGRFTHLLQREPWS